MKIAICGVSGVVGREILHCLSETKFPVNNEDLCLFASKRSEGTEINTPFGKKIIQEFELSKVQQFDFVFLCIGGSFSEKYGHDLTAHGAIVIDNSSYFRYKKDVPLIIPEINPFDIGSKKLIANPNCTTAILSMALYPIAQEFGLNKVIVSTYQATSGAGKAAMDELSTQTQNFLDNKPVINKEFKYPIPFNIIPQIDVFQENGYTKEEMKVTWETRKIFNIHDLKISCTAVRIPTFRAHAESVTVETNQKVTLDKVLELWKKSPGLEIVDNPEKLLYPMPLTATKKFDVEVGRLRKNEIFGDKGLDFFVCGDQLLRGAALNAVKIAHLYL